MKGRGVDLQFISVVLGPVRGLFGDPTTTRAIPELILLSVKEPYGERSALAVTTPAPDLADEAGMRYDGIIDHPVRFLAVSHVVGVPFLCPHRLRRPAVLLEKGLLGVLLTFL